MIQAAEIAMSVTVLNHQGNGNQMQNSIRNMFIASCLALCAFVTTAAHAKDTGTKEEAVAMVKKAVAFLKANGKDKAFAEFSKKDGQFVDRDLYVMVYDFTGKNLAHGANERLIGKNLMEIKDPDGKQLIREMTDLAQSKGRGWVDYKWTHPVTKSIDPKSTYVEKTDDLWIGVGIYR
jgi:cytochrome c